MIEDTPAPPLHVVAAVIFDGDAVLACRRNKDRAAGGKWEFPGGKVEPGEVAADALVREIREELGISIFVGEALTTDDTAVGGQVIRLTCFHASLRDARPTRSSDHDAMTWLAPRRLAELDWAEPDLPAVRILTEPSS